MKSAINKHVCVGLMLHTVGNVLWRAVAVTVISTRVYRGSLNRSGAESEWFCSSARALLHLDCGVEVTGLHSAPGGMCAENEYNKGKIETWDNAGAEEK